MSQQPSRPWFRLASMVRPPAPPVARPPAPAPAQPQPFRPQVPPTQAGEPTPRPPPPIFPSVTPRTSAPPSPILPATPTPPVSSPVAPRPTRDTAPPTPTPTQAAPPPPQATAPPSPSKTPFATLTSPATWSPKSPAKTGEIQPTFSTIRPPTVTSARSPTSPITKTSSSLPASPGQKASTQIAVTYPGVSHSSLPSSPKTKPSAPPPSPLPTSPAFKTVPSSPFPPQPSSAPTSVSIPTVTARTNSSMASPKINKPWVETPPQSTKEKLLSRPPSPLTLPPAQIKSGSDLEPIPALVEQKTVLLQETEEKSKTTAKTSNGYMIRSHSTETHNNSIAQHGKRELKKDKGIHSHKKHSDSEESGVRVVTLAGENKGAIMELSPSRKKNGCGSWINGGQKLKSDSDEGTTRMKDEKHKASPTETAPMDAFVNCNVQGVNNSILYNCSCNHNDPGVHLSVSRKSNGGHGLHH